MGWGLEVEVRGGGGLADLIRIHLLIDIEPRYHQPVLQGV